MGGALDQGGVVHDQGKKALGFMWKAQSCCLFIVGVRQWKGRVAKKRHVRPRQHRPEVLTPCWIFIM